MSEEKKKKTKIKRTHSDISLNNKLNKWLAMETVIITDKYTSKSIHDMCTYIHTIHSTHTFSN